MANEKLKLIGGTDDTLPTVLQGPDGYHCTPVGNAERLHRDRGQDIRWVAGRNHRANGTFFIWTGNRWEQDTRGQVRVWATENARNLGKLVVLATEQGLAPKQIEAYIKFWAISESEHAITSVVTQLGPHVSITRGEFDADPMLLGVQNGVIDLLTHEFREARREDYITKLCNASFNPNAACPTWNRFLLETTDGDRELVRYLQQCAGICLTGLVEEHKFFLVVGPGGTGKTTFQEALRHVWGDYYEGVDPSTLAATKNDSPARARPDVAKLQGVRLVLANETRAGFRIDENMLKVMTGGDTLTARHLFEAEFDFTPTHKIWLRTNHMPQLDGGDTGIRRRVRVVPFRRVVEVKDARLPAKLRGEADGILQWALAGLRDYQHNGLAEPKVVVDATNDYLDAMDMIKQFISECCVVGAKERAAGLTLYTTYKRWVEERGHYPIAANRFASELQDRGYNKRHTEAGATWFGLSVKGVREPISDADVPFWASPLESTKPDGPDVVTSYFP